MYVELKHIRQPKPQPPRQIIPISDLSDKKNTKKKHKIAQEKGNKQGRQAMSKTFKETIPTTATRNTTLREKVT